MSAATIRIRGVRKVFETDNGPVEALSGVDLDIPAGSIVTLVGASGCGKSTLLRIIAGLDYATSGDVLIGRRRVDGPGPDRAVVFQSYSLYPWLTVAQNIAFAARLSAHRSTAGENRQTEERSRALMQLVGLEKFAQSYPHQLSGGMQQRVAIARALLTRPPILLMDEPFGALDAQMRELMQQLLLRVHAEEGMTTVFVTHDVAEAAYLGHKVVVLAPGPGRVDSIHDAVRSAAGPFDPSAAPATQALETVLRSRIRDTSTHMIDTGLLDTLGMRTTDGAGEPDNTTAYTGKGY